MVLLQVVVVYDRGTTMFQCLQLHQSPDVFRQELQPQKQQSAIFAINKKQLLSKEIACPVIKCCVLRAATTLVLAHKMTSLSNVRIAVRVLHKTLSIFLIQRLKFNCYLACLLCACLLSCLILILIFKFIVLSISYLIIIL